MNTRAVVLGVQGMVGRTLFAFLKIPFPDSIFGTVQNLRGLKKDLFLFRARYAKNDFNKIYKKLKKIDYVINCIGAKNGNEASDLVFVNSYFPHVLSDIAGKFNFNLIHISTDAVFGPLSGKVNEYDTPNPTSLYGISKLLGEPKSDNAITIRTSPIGFNPLKQDSLLERALRSKNEAFKGFVNQKWSGCTALQFAKLCKNIIIKNNFNKLRKISHIYHFSPLGPTTKYKLIYNFLKVKKLPFKTKKIKGKKKNRVLTTIFFDILNIDQYTNNTKEALKELLDFEKTIKNHGEKT